MTPLYAGIGGVVRELTEMYAGVGGVVKPMTEMWAGVGGVNRQIFSAVTLPEFTVNGRPYQFEPGMTWGEFIASEYNTDKIWSNFTMVIDPITNNAIYDPSGHVCVVGVEIIENGAYTS